MDVLALSAQSDPLNSSHKYLNINPEGALLQESQDIAEELGIMLRIYNQQLNVVKDFKKGLVSMNEEFDKRGSVEIAIAKLLLAAQPNLQIDRAKDEEAHQGDVVPQHTIQEAEDLIEHIANRQAEIQDLEDAALNTNRQVGTTNLL